MICESARPYDLNEKDTGGAKGSLCGRDKKGFRLIVRFSLIPFVYSIPISAASLRCRRRKSFTFRPQTTHHSS